MPSHRQWSPLLRFHHHGLELPALELELFAINWLFRYVELLLLNKMLLRFTYAVASMSSLSFFLMLGIVLSYRHNTNLFIQSPAGGHLRRFQLGRVIVHRAATKILL